MAVTHSTVVVVADDGTSPVGTTEWNADHVTATISLSGVSANRDQLLITDTTLGAGLTIGGDAKLYRSGATVLKTDGYFICANDIYALGTLFATGQATQNGGKNILDIDHTAAADPHTVYRLKSTAESNVYIQDPGTFTIPDSGRLTQPVRLALSSTERLTNAGTGRAVVSDAPYDPSALKYRSPGSVALTSDEYVTEYQRVELRGNSRKSMFGTGCAIITGFNPIGRLVLAGSGGGQ